MRKSNVTVKLNKKLASKDVEVANNILVIISWLLMSHWLGTSFFWSCYAVVMTASAAIFICIFFVQHNFQGSYANGTDNWSYLQAAIEGSSNLEVPR